MPDNNTENLPGNPKGNSLLNILGSAAFFKSAIICIIFLYSGASVGYVIGNQFKDLKPRIVTLIGTANIAVKADKATISILTDNVQPDRDKASSEDKKVVQQIYDILQKNNVSRQNISITSSYTAINDTTTELDKIDPQITPTPTPLPKKVNNQTEDLSGESYTSSTAIEVKIEKNAFKNTQTIQNALWNLKGISEVTTLYDVDDLDKYKLEAKNKAIANAREQAEKIASINHTGISRIVSVKDLMKDKTVLDSLYEDTIDTSFSEDIITVNAKYEISYELR